MASATLDELVLRVLALPAVLDPRSMKTALLSLLALVGCASTPNTPDTPHFDFASDTYRLQPGEEKYFCYTTNLPADRDIAITRLTPKYGPGTHHILFAQALAPEPPGFSECPVLTKQTWVPLYGGGKDSGPLELPPQVAFKPFNRGQQVIMQLHLQNSGDAPITGTTSIRTDYVESTPEIMQAGIFGLDNRHLVIPAHTLAATNEMSCVLNADIDVFAVLGHMHKRGVRIELSRGATVGAEMLFQESWDFDAQPITSFELELKKGDQMFTRCTHRNEGDTPIVYGESSDTEMCILVMYYAPIGMPGVCIKT